MVLKKAFEWTENDFIHGWGYFKDGFKDKDNIKDRIDLKIWMDLKLLLDEGWLLN